MTDATQNLANAFDKAGSNDTAGTPAPAAIAAEIQKLAAALVEATKEDTK